MSATYVLPQVTLKQVFSASVAATRQKQLAVIMGGHASVYQYDVAADKPLILLGNYDQTGENVGGEWKTCYAWPNRPTGGVVDQSFTKLFIDNALLRYFSDSGHTMIKTAANEIRHPTKAFADNPLDAATYPKHSTLYDRGVKVGDPIYVKGSDGVDDYELMTYVKAIKGDAVAAIVAAATANSANQATVILATSYSADSDNTGSANISASSAASYTGFVEGNVSETYTVECIQASTGGDHTTARLRITSASGNDDVSSQAPSAASYTTPIGTRGGTATFTGSDFAVGDIWTVTFREAFTAPTATSGGTYTGDTDTTYIVEVTTGGTAGGSSTDDPYITCRAADGSDFSGPTQVTASATAIAVGTKGATVSFNQTKLRKGDRYNIGVTAATTGLMKTLVLGHSLNSAIPLNTAGTSLLEIELFIKTDLEVDPKSVSVSGEYTWEQNSTQICVFADLYAYASDWTVSDVLTALPVIAKGTLTSSYNKMYSQVRYWRSDLATSLNSITSVGDLDTLIPGPLVPENHLKWNVYYALQNANGQPVYFVAIGDPSVSSDWIYAIDLLERYTDTYSLVPLTYNATFLNLVHAHVTSMSDEFHKKFRRLWVNLQPITTKLLVDATKSSDESVVLATTEDDSDTTGSQYTILRITSANADLVELGVVAGDEVRYKFGTDAWGDESYSTYIIDEVVNEDTIRLVTGTTVAESTPIKVEIYRNLSKTDQAAAIAATAGQWADRRVSAVWPDTVGSGGTTFEGWSLCSALAALASGVSPNQGLTHVEISGFDDLTRTTEYFSETQLDVLAANGTHIVTEDSESGEIYSRHALTTADYEEQYQREEMVCRNVDSISFRFAQQFAPYIGKTNAVKGMVEIIGAETQAVIQDLRVPISNELGPQLVDATVTDLRISPVFKDTIVLTIDCEVPLALNNIGITLLI